MESSTILLISILIIAAIAGFAFLKHKSGNSAPDHENPLLELRQKLLTEPMEQLGIEASNGENKVYGVLMEMGFRNDAASLVALLDGTTSLYFSKGGGMIGLGEHLSVRRLAIPFVQQANEVFANLTKVSEFPFPKNKTWTFYVITENGVYAGNAKNTLLMNGKHSLSEYAHLGNDLMTRVRMLQERDGKPFSNEELLQEAVSIQDMDAVRDYLREEVDVNAGDQTGLTPLMMAAYHGNVEIMNMLLEKGASLELKDEEGYTALIFTSNAGKPAAGQRLIELGANVNARANDNSTPIMFAAQHGYNEVVKLLLASGADPQFQGSHGLSAILFAQQNGLTETEKILVDFIK